MKRSKKPPEKDNVVVSSSWELFDNCPVCRLMKQAAEENREPSQEELETAFAKANEQN